MCSSDNLDVIPNGSTMLRYQVPFFRVCTWTRGSGVDYSGFGVREWFRRDKDCELLVRFRLVRFRRGFFLTWNGSMGLNSKGNVVNTYLDFAQ